LKLLTNKKTTMKQIIEKYFALTNEINQATPHIKSGNVAPQIYKFATNNAIRFGQGIIIDPTRNEITMDVMLIDNEKTLEYILDDCDTQFLIRKDYYEKVVADWKAQKTREYENEIINLNK